LSLQSTVTEDFVWFAR